MGFSRKTRRELETLTWRYVDDMIEPEQMQRLETLLKESEEARRHYVNCMMLHAHLHEFFASQRPGARGSVRIANDTFLSQLLDQTVAAPAEGADHKPAEPQPANTAASTTKSPS